MQFHLPLPLLLVCKGSEPSVKGHLGSAWGIWGWIWGREDGFGLYVKGGSGEELLQMNTNKLFNL